MASRALGPYTLMELIGAGGMGEVYRAHDSRLKRSVALKLLPEGSGEDREQLQRFQREAQAASALNHPHIVSIFDAGEIEGTVFIAMELVDGVPVTEWAARERPSVARILDVFVQIADALAAAHAIGIVHRDVKSSNILVDAQGYAKVLDFGLAKFAPAGGESTAATHLATQAGIVLGTVAYMSPEQAMGVGVDPRTDIFSLGVLLYETLTGRHPFARPTQLDVLHAIVHDPPAPFTDGSPELGWILGKALAKERDERYQSMREFGADLRRLRRALDSAPAVPHADARRRRRVPIAIWIVVVGMAAALAGLALGRRDATGTVTGSPIARLTPLTTDAGFEGEPTFSPDGKLIAYVSDRTGNFDIFLKRIDGGPDIQLTNDPGDDVQPAFSPAGNEIAFVSGRNFPGGIVYPSPEAPLVGGNIWVMPAFGGEPRRVATGNHPAWMPDGSAIVYVSGRWFGRRLMRVSPLGGDPKVIELAPNGNDSFSDVRRPAVSPDGRWIAFESRNTLFLAPSGGGRPALVAPGRDPAWAPDSRSIFFTATGSALNGALARAGVSAQGPTAGAPELISASGQRTAEPAVASDGIHVAFAAETVRGNVEAVAFDADGGRAVPGAVPRPLTTGNEVIFFFSVAPDGRTLTYDVRGRIWKLESNGPAVALTDGTRGRDTYPRWSPDGRLIAFARGGSGARGNAPADLWMMNPDGSDPRRIGAGANLTVFFSWTPDSRGIITQFPGDRQFHRVELSGGDRVLTNDKGLLGAAAISSDQRWLVVQSTNPDTGDSDLHAVLLDGSRSSRLVARTPGDDVHPMLSPSGKWLFWIVDHRNVFRVPGPAQGWRATPPEKVTSFPESGLFLEDPQLSADGRTLFYSRRERTADLWLMELKPDARK